MNLYLILGISKEATKDEIKKAYRKRARETHPDRNSGDDAEFKDVQLAWEVLSDPDRKQYYDETGEYENKAKQRKSALVTILNQMFHTIIGQMIGGNLDVEKEDIADWMRKGLNSLITDLHGNIKTNKKAAALLKKTLGKFKTKGCEDNFMESLIQIEIAKVEGFVVSNNQDIQLIKEALELFKDYIFQHEEKVVTITTWLRTSGQIFDQQP